MHITFNMEIYHQGIKYSDKKTEIIKFGITSESSLDNKKIDILTHVEEKIHDKVKNAFYGKDIETFLIGLICVERKAVEFFPVRKPPKPVYFHELEQVNGFWTPNFGANQLGRISNAHRKLESASKMP